MHHSSRSFSGFAGAWLPRARRWGLILPLLLTASLVWAGATGPEAVPPVPKGDIQLNKDKPFRAAAGVPATVAPGGSIQLRYTVHVLDSNHYLYKEMMKVVLKPAAGVTYGPVQFSRAPETKYDQFEERDREIYKATVTMYVDAKVAADAKPGPLTLEATVHYQGCNPTVCFMPTKENFTHPLQVGGKQAAADSSVAGDSQASAGGETGEGSAADPVESEPAAALASTASSPTGAASDAPAAPVAAGAAAGAVEAAPVTAGAVPGAAAGAADAASAGAALVATTGPALTGTAVSAAVAPAQAVSGGFLTFDPSKGLLWMFVVAFLGGVVASLTPCVYPIIPITLSVLGARNSASKLHGFSLALVYVLGLSVTYTILGVVAATTGALFGSLMQSSWVLGAISVLFIAMGFSMMGFFDVTLPSDLTNRLSGVRGRGYPGAFLTGAVAGLVASPCIGPLIVSLLTYIAQTGNVVVGAALMFTFAFGMGQLFLLLGTFAVSMPRSGAWMDTVKGVLSLMLFGVGLYYLSFVVPPGYYELLMGASAVLAGTFVGAFDPITEEAAPGSRLNKGLGILMLVVGIYSVLGGLVGTGLLAPQLSLALQRPAVSAPNVAVATGSISWSTDYEAKLAQAQAEQRPVLIDFTADWCAACKELEHYTFTDPRVIRAAQDFVTIRVDGTDETPLFTRLKEKYGILGLPYVLFIDASGQKLEPLTVTGFVKADEFLRRMCQVQSPTTRSLQDVCRS